MSTKIKDERVDARILEATLTREDVATALYEFVCRRAKVQDYEAETLDMAKSTFGFEFGDLRGDVKSATVTVRLDTSRLPKSAPAPTPPSFKDLEKILMSWGRGTGGLTIEQAMSQIQDLCR